MVKVIGIALVLILKLREEVEDVEGKCRCRTVDRCWKPACTEELSVFWEDSIATTVTDNETVNTRQVEHHEILEVGGGGARDTNVVAKLDNEAQGSKGDIVEEGAIPHLRHISIDDVR